MPNKVNVDRDTINKCFVSLDNRSIFLLGLAARRFTNTFSDTFLLNLIDMCRILVRNDSKRTSNRSLKEFNYFVDAIEEYLEVD